MFLRTESGLFLINRVYLDRIAFIWGELGSSGTNWVRSGQIGIELIRDKLVSLDMLMPNRTRSKRIKITCDKLVALASIWVRSDRMGLVRTEAGLFGSDRICLNAIGFVQSQLESFGPYLVNSINPKVSCLST